MFWQKFKCSCKGQILSVAHSASSDLSLIKPFASKTLKLKIPPAIAPLLHARLPYITPS